MVYKAAKLIDWTWYNAETAAVDAIISQTSSAKLQQKVLQENPKYLELVDLGISQEQAKKKATKLPEDSESFKQENKQLKHKFWHKWWKISTKGSVGTPLQGSTESSRNYQQLMRWWLGANSWWFQRGYSL